MRSDPVCRRFNIHGPIYWTLDDTLGAGDTVLAILEQVLEESAIIDHCLA